MQKKSVKLKLLNILCLFVFAPFSVVFLYFNLTSKNYYISAVLLLVISIIPFFAYFEKRKIKTSETAIVAVMTAICVVSRAVFAFVPQVKPMCAFACVAAVAFGANVGFVIGALSVLISNFIFGQGMFTPFQMLAMGLTCFLVSLCFYKKKLSSNKIAVSIVSAVLCFAVYGFIVDTCSVLMMLSEFTPQKVLSVYLSGVPFNLVHGATTGIVMFFIYKPMSDKFLRLRTKYGIFDGEE